MAKRVSDSEIPRGKRPSFLCAIHLNEVSARNAHFVTLCTMGAKPGAGGVKFQLTVCKSISCKQCKKPFEDDALVILGKHKPTLYHIGCRSHERTTRNFNATQCMVHRVYMPNCNAVPVSANGSTKYVCPGDTCSQCLTQAVPFDKVDVVDNAFVHVRCATQCIVCAKTITLSGSTVVKACEDCATFCGKCRTDITVMALRTPTSNPNRWLCVECSRGSKPITWFKCGNDCIERNHSVTWTCVTTNKCDKDPVVVCDEAQCVCCEQALNEPKIYDDDRDGFIAVEDQGFCGNGTCVLSCSVCYNYVGTHKYHEDGKPYACKDCSIQCVACESELYDSDDRENEDSDGENYCLKCWKNRSDSDSC